MAAQVDFPEIDLRQRLTVSRGYGVAEISIPEGSDYVGKTIGESGLREKDIVVLTLYRGTTVIPNPRPQRQLEAGDRLLCFGKLDLMRDLIPAKVRRSRRPIVQELPDLPVAEEVLRDASSGSDSAFADDFPAKKTICAMTETRKRKPIDEWFGEEIPAWRVSRCGPGRERELQRHDRADSHPHPPGRGVGPVVFVTAALHGDEINGTGAIRQLILDPDFAPAAGGGHPRARAESARL